MDGLTLVSLYGKYSIGSFSRGILRKSNFNRTKEVLLDGISSRRGFAPAFRHIVPNP